MSSPSWKLGRLSKESNASKLIYNWFLRRNSAYVTTIFAVAIVGGMAFDKFFDVAWESSNKGVRAAPPAPARVPSASRTPRLPTPRRSSGRT